MTAPMKNVLVLGGSYGGGKAVQVLAEKLSVTHRIVLIDRNSHVNHLYALPRYSVLGGHSHKAFIPYTNVFNAQASPLSSQHHHLFLQAQITGMTAHSVTLDRTFPKYGLNSPEISFDYAVYALGSHLPAPIDLWASEHNWLNPSKSSTEVDGLEEKYGGTKAEGIKWLSRAQERIQNASSCLIIGGGALGIQYATDIASIYPTKHVTLLHSRPNLLPRFDPKMHTEIMKVMDDLRIDVILGERLDLSSALPNSAKIDGQSGHRIVRTEKGREIAADLILLCTGQIPNTGLLRTLSPEAINPQNGKARVLKTLQLDASPQTASNGHEKKEGVKTTSFPNIFVVGDAADAFGALASGRHAFHQAEIACNNICKMIESHNTSETENTSFNEPELETYTPNPPDIKVELGLGKSLYQLNEKIGRIDDQSHDLDSVKIWKFFGMGDVKEEDTLV